MSHRGPIPALIAMIAAAALSGCGDTWRVKAGVEIVGHLHAAPGEHPPRPIRPALSERT